MQTKSTGDAIADLMEIRRYIAQDNPRAANDVALCINKTVYLLEQPAKYGEAGNGGSEIVISRLIIPYR